MYVKKRRLKKKPIIILVGIILAIILFIILFKTIKHYTSYEYKLGKIGYNENEITYLVKKDDKTLDKALEKYDADLMPLTKEKYFMWKNYKTYKNYIKTLKEESDSINYNEVVTKVNVKRNNNYYTNTTTTDMDMGNAILVNKYYSLPEKYAPKDVVKISNTYAYGTNSIRKEVYEAFKNMFNAAKKENITLIINSGYRTYESQKEVYDMYKNDKGEEYADSIAARPNFSEHQSGLALDIITYGTSGKNFDKTDAFKWLSNHAHEYGFILRYPEGKENITGYAYESWHYRYLGKDLATKVKQSGLTYEEYYAYYLDGDNKNEKKKN